MSFKLFLRFKQTLSLFEEVRSQAFAALFLIVFMGITEGASLLLIIPLLAIAGVGSDAVSSNKLIGFVKSLFEFTDTSLSVTNVLVLYILLMTLYAMLRYFQSINTAAINQRIVIYWRNTIFRKLSIATWESIQSIRNSDIQNTLTLEVRKFGSISNQLIQLSGTLIIIMVYLIVSALLSLQLTILAILPIILIALLNRPINKQAFILGKSAVGFNQQLQNIILEHYNALKLVKSYGKEEEHLHEFKATNRELEQKALAFAKATQKTKTLFEIIAAILIAIYIYVAIVVFQTALTELLLLIYIFVRLLPKVTRLITSYQQILNNLPAIQETNNLLEKLKEEKPNRGDSVSPILFQNAIVFNEVCFAYDTNKVLQHINFSIPAFQTSVIKGDSGVGKTTTIDLIMGLQKAQSGTILIDDISLDEINNQKWKSNIAYVPQDPFLFHKSIRENLIWASTSVDDQTIWNALEQAGAKEFVKELPNNLETIVGDRGIKISGGERQRIALARAILKQPQILILDEATNAIDDQNELLIKNALGKLNGKMTIVIVAHRSSLIELADHIIELN